MIDINYWEDRKGIVNEVSMDLDQLLVIAEQGIAGNQTFFRDLKRDVIEHVTLYKQSKVESESSTEV